MSPGDDRGRPYPERPASIATDKDSIPTQLRRRRAASRRMEPLDDGTGRSDPLDPLPAPKAKPPRFVTVIVDDQRRVFLLRGSRGFVDVLRAEGMKPTWSAAARGWWMHTRRLPDALAILEWASYAVRIKNSPGGEAA
jgi:hypothetical protein